MVTDRTRRDARRGGVRLAFAVALAVSVQLPWSAFARAPDGPQLAQSAARQMQVLAGLKTARTGAQSKLDSALHMGMLHARREPQLAALPDFRFLKPDQDGRTPVEIILADADGYKRVLDTLESLGAVTVSRSRDNRLITARVGFDHLEPLASIPQVRKIRRELPSRVNAINRSEGEQTHGVQLARGIYGATGAGVKACVISDGVDSLASVVASGDLPAGVEVLPGQAGSGSEGTAMLEILHDLAPQASLAFATGTTNLATYAQNILDLAGSGCNVIVDNVFHLSESPFQDGPAAQAVNTVTAAGVLYFSAAGNLGNTTDLTSGTWEGSFVANGTLPGLGGAGLVHDFGDGGQSVLVESGGNSTPVLLVWAEHYELATGLASTDYDLYVLNNAMTTVFDASTNTQDGMGGDDYPIEFVGSGAFSGERLVVARAAAGATSSTPMFNLTLVNGELDDNLATGGSIRGAGAAADAFSVAATPIGSPRDAGPAAGPFPGLFSSANESESFTGQGPRRVILSPTGAELTPGNRTGTGGVVRQKPELTAADGVATATPGFNPFYGTSAAAAHAAGIATLLKSALPSITPAQVRTTLLSSAIDIEAPGVDDTTGAGIVMAEAALTAAGAPTFAFLSAATPVFAQAGGDGDAFVETHEDWAVEFPLQHAGGGTASSITATLASLTPGVQVLAASSSYPDLAAGATASNDTPFLFHVGPQVQCGTVLEFQLTVEYSGGATPSQQFSASVQSGGPGAPVAFSYTGPAVPIPDGSDLSGAAPGAPASADLPIIGITSVHSLTMSIDGTACSSAVGSTTVGLSHTFVNDLEISLVSPTGTAVKVIDNTDGSGNNFCQTVLDDQSPGPGIQTVTPAQAPFTGSFTPAQSLAAFAGESAEGTWQLRAQDFFSSDTGSIRAFTVNVVPAVCDAPVATVGLSATKTVSGGDLGAGGSVVYTVSITNNGNSLQPDNAGHEFTDMLPAGLVVGTPTASAGTVSGPGVNPVTWDGTVPAGGTVTITIPATISAAAGASIVNQATVNFDADRDGSNESSAPSDDPSLPGSADATTFQVAQGVLAIGPASTDFGNVAVGSNSAVATVTVSNSGAASLQVAAIDAATAPFERVASGTCAATVPFAIAAGASCTLAYRFTPVAAGAAHQTLAVSSDGGDGSFSLAGTGTQGQLTVTPGTLAFGAVQVGLSASATLTLGNAGDAALTVSAIDAANAPFALAGGSCGALPITIAAGAACTLDYTFAPVAAGAASQTLGITSDVDAASVALTGTGTQGVLSLSTTTLGFGAVQVGQAASRSLTVTNAGTAALQVTSVGAPAAPFSMVGGTCDAVPFTLAAGASCTITYRFAPTTAGAASQSFDVVSDAGTTQVAASGTGVAAAPGTPIVIPATSTSGMALLAALLGLLGWVGYRRRG